MVPGRWLGRMDRRWGSVTEQTAAGTILTGVYGDFRRPTYMTSDTISILDGSTFIVSDRRGDIQAAPDEPHGLFYRDTRFLSRWVLTFNGAPLTTLSTDETAYSAAQFFLYPPTGTIYENPTVSVIRKRMVGDGFHEDLTVINHGQKPIDIELRLEAASDIADIFEVKDALAKKGEAYRSAGDGKMVLGYRREGFKRETHVSSSMPADLFGDALVFRLHLAPHNEWSTCIVVHVVSDRMIAVKYDHGEDTPKPNLRVSLAEWLAPARASGDAREVPTPCQKRLARRVGVNPPTPRRIPSPGRS